MGASGGIMSAASTISSSYAQSEAYKRQGSYEQMQDNANARLAEIQGKDALKQGDLQASAALRKGKEVAGEQDVSAASQGVDVASGSAKDLTNQTKDYSALDAMTAKNNAWRQAWGFQVQANDSIGKGEMASLAGNSASQNTLLTGGMQAAGYLGKAYESYSRNATPSSSNKINGAPGYKRNSSYTGSDDDTSFTKYFGVKY